MIEGVIPTAQVATKEYNCDQFSQSSWNEIAKIAKKNNANLSLYSRYDNRIHMIVSEW